MPRDTYDEFTAIVRHVAYRTGDRSCPEAAAAKLTPWLGFIGRGEGDPAWCDLRLEGMDEPPPWSVVEDECRVRLKAAGRWIAGEPAGIAALIDDIACMDPSYRAARYAALGQAWAHLLAA